MDIVLLVIVRRNVRYAEVTNIHKEKNV
jgi:hypothetical protein